MGSCVQTIVEIRQKNEFSTGLDEPNAEGLVRLYYFISILNYFMQIHLIEQSPLLYVGFACTPGATPPIATQIGEPPSSSSL